MVEMKWRRKEKMDGRNERKLIIALAPHYHFPKFPSPLLTRIRFRSR